jgi:hypothetical protein
MKNAGSAAFSQDDSNGAWKLIKAATFTANYGQQHEPLEPSVQNDFFASIVQSTSEATEPRLTCNLKDCFKLEQLQTSTVERMLIQIKSSTATGPDELPGILLKELAFSLAPTITRIFNASITQNNFPILWKQANVTAVYKNKGSKTEPGNYRPISVLPVHVHWTLVITLYLGAKVKPAL